MQIGRAVVDLRAFTVRRGEETLRLSAQEVSLLRVFVRAADPSAAGARTATVSREVLFRDGLGYRSAERSRALDYAVRRLRTKLGDDTAGRAALETVRGEGYRLTWSPTAPPARPGPATVGRHGWLDRITGVVEAGELCTLVGPPGVGKSHLARVWQAGTEGVVWLDRPQPHPVAGGLVVDRCETDLEGARRLAREGLARGHAVVCTSRRRLGLPDERVLDVPPLPRSEAMELLRMHVVRAGAPVPSEAGLDALCAACDDLALALVLVAPRLRSLPPARLVRRLLDDGRDQDGLDVILETAWAGLSPEARQVLPALAALRGPLSLEGVEAAVPAGLDALAVVEELVEHSILVVRHHAGLGLRYHLLRPLERAVRRRSMRDAPVP